jgi:hypothetical protein
VRIIALSAAFATEGHAKISAAFLILGFANYVR